ncbi:MAG: cell division protein ZipA C-terminal FtsZ-binding domain-containing protein [Rhodocyclaceae bacterium]|nr:cell division protein ZipA C-terminal FtsZ-binding domain-containing protein [Rhodocyclaceae bacterium]
MSELQLGLIGLGVGLVAGVWAYNLWQERRHRRRAAAILPEPAADALMKDRAAPVRQEPQMASASEPRREPVAGAACAEAGRDEPVSGECGAVPPAPTFQNESATGGTSRIPPAPTLRAESAPGAMAAPAPADTRLGAAGAPRIVPVPDEWADGRADCLLCVEFAEPVSVSALWADYSAWAGKLDKPVQWLGLDERTRRWRNLSPQDPGAVVQVAAALQLVDRRGPVSAATLEVFLKGVHRLAQGFAGLVDLPDPAPILATATALDAFCAGVDLQFSLQVVPRSGSLAGMPGAKLKPLLDAAGLKLEGERFIAADDEGAVRFMLGCATANAQAVVKLESAVLTALILSLDVPRTPNGAASFDRMLAFARQCAEAVGGQLVDAHHKPLAEATIAAIRARIAEIQARMAEQGIPAGGVRALRLFA